MFQGLRVDRLREQGFGSSGFKFWDLGARSAGLLAWTIRSQPTTHRKTEGCTSAKDVES